MSGWDQGQVFVSGGGGHNNAKVLDGDTLHYKASFLRFIRGWKNQNNAFIYREQLIQHFELEKYYLEVNMDHLTQFDQDLASSLLSKPNEVVPTFEMAAKEAIKMMNFAKEDKDIPDIQVLFTSSADATAIRTLKAHQIAKIVKIPGIVISASRTQPRPLSITIKCRGCKHEKTIHISPGINTNPLPQGCDNPQQQLESKQCPNNPYDILPEKSKFVNQQLLKLQESPETIPTGEMPRHIQLSVDRFLVERVTPGTRITVVGVFGIYAGQGGRKKEMSGLATIRTPYIRVLGMLSNDQAGRSAHIFTPQEEDAFRKFATKSDLLEILSSSIAPSIYGHQDIKRAIACQLFGGSPKRLPDRMKLRGDINLLLLGDPGTAKSQLLKFVEKVAPIAVYTSGKGSSAAGLTASVIREPSTGEYYLEGGAMVVADGGIVCIDEFDKMDVNDRVAIHEAMEQQTISIAKAGITTILNSRTSVLAAANPVFGRYDDLKTAGENIDFQSTILSRFDLIFIVRDPKDSKRDMEIADKVLQNHMNAASTDANTELDLNFLKKYITFCRTRCSPRLSEDAVEALMNHYVSVRATVRENEMNGQPGAIPITIRQLEAIVRISESLAKMSLSNTASSRHVQEAIRLFTISTFDAITTNSAMGEQLTPQMVEDISKAETQIKRRIAIGSKVSLKKVVEELSSFGQLSTYSIRKAFDIMVKRDEMEYFYQGKIVHRKN
ncbi:MCM family protein [Cavenderia fasciculata]|uniref:DNA replication licensing factor MCM5 n=1 Tax=Cavenderia fasciculata TaxID=261658 RepID=F4PS78_CACFS|nr:MCM family protein [Cavenderia fasciculata]EGG21461.1 MCM family protein [Cavenderia fasciculata]|eukprot:XP_004359311.1 MCM family protein [Cavenderia fasciculata]